MAPCNGSLKDETAGGRSVMMAQLGNAMLDRMRTESVCATYSLHHVLCWGKGSCALSCGLRINLNPSFKWLLRVNCPSCLLCPYLFTWQSE
jgi:hypothetical protein